MWEALPQVLLAIGGLGLFLLGMMTLTDGLHGLAGNVLRRVLRRFTTSPLSGALTGAGVTAVLQSSSATTVAAVGFVGAGLMTFPQALGIIFGANIGTTMTGWIVAIVGFKLDLAQAVMPLILLGALIRMFGEGRLRHFGTALAGFSLLFIGIEAMQSGMAPFQGAVTPDSFPQDTLIGRLQLVMIGVGITLITQSSSAGVVTALVALDAGAISFPQAAAMVIGMDVGTTATTALATIGGSTATKRTGYSHVVYNCLTAVMALLLLTPYTQVMGNWFDLATPADAQVALVGFHSGFNVLGVVLIVGFTHRFADFIRALVPDSGPKMTERLDRRFLKDPAAAVDAVAATSREIAREMSNVVVRLLTPDTRDSVKESLDAVRRALEETGDFTDQIKTTLDQESAHRRHVAALHALDHLRRLYDRCTQTDRIDLIRLNEDLQALSRQLTGRLAAENALQSFDAGFVDDLNGIRKAYREARETYRTKTIGATSLGEIETERAVLRLDSVRWLHRVAYHAWRIAHHLQRAETEQPEKTGRIELESERDLD